MISLADAQLWVDGHAAICKTYHILESTGNKEDASTAANMRLKLAAAFALAKNSPVDLGHVVAAINVDPMITYKKLRLLALPYYVHCSECNRAYYSSCGSTCSDCWSRMFPAPDHSAWSQ